MCNSTAVIARLRVKRNNCHKKKKNIAQINEVTGQHLVSHAGNQPREVRGSRNLHGMGANSCEGGRQEGKLLVEFGPILEKARRLHQEMGSLAEPERTDRLLAPQRAGMPPRKDRQEQAEVV